MATFELTLVDKVSGAAKSVASGLGAVTGALKQVATGDISGLLKNIGAGAQSAVGALAGALATLGPYGQAAASVLMVVTGGVSSLASALYDGMAAAISMAEGGAKIKSTFAALAGGEKAGGAVLKMLGDLGEKLPFSSGQIRDWGQSLLAAGIKGDALKNGVKAIASAQALMGDSGAAAAEKMITGLSMGGDGAAKMMKTIQGGGKKAATLLADMGLQTADLAKAMGLTPAQFAKAKLSTEQMSKAVEIALKKKGKGPLDDMMGSWPVIIAKAKAGFMSLFGGLGPAVKPFMAAVRGLFGNFNKGTPIIKTLQKVFTEVFGTLFKYATKAVTAISGFVKANVTAKNLGAIWKVIKSGISAVAGAAMSAGSALKSAFVTALPTLKKIGSAAMAVGKWLLKVATSATGMKVIKAIAIGIAVVLGVLVVGAALLWAGFVIGVAIAGAALSAVVAIVVMFAQGVVSNFQKAVGVVRAVGAAIGNFASSAISSITGFVSGAIGALAGLAGGAMSAAGAFIQGLLGGIQNGAGAIIAAVKGIAMGALGAFKSVLGIASPSAVMAGMGGQFSAGAAQGIDAGSSKVAASADKMGSTAANKAADGMSSGGGAGAKGGKAGGGKGGGLNVTFAPGSIVITGAAGDPLEVTEAALTMILERLAITQGLMAPT